MEHTIIKIKLGQLLNSLSYALDAAENRYFNHSRRTAYIAYKIAREMELDERDIADTYFISLIHDIGMAGYLSKYSVSHIHMDFNLRKQHCQIGYEIIEKLPHISKKKDYLLYHHEEYDGTGPYGLKGEEIPLVAQIIHIADFFELFYFRQERDVKKLNDIDKVHKWLDKYRNKMFSNRVCDGLLYALKKDKFWFDLMNGNIGIVLQFIEPNRDILIDIKDLRKISEAFSIIIDLKSKFTYNHSQGISNITSKFASFLGYNPLMIEKLTIAADLHDIGKFVVPVSLIEKPGKLTAEEFLIMKSHVYYTKLILKQIDGIEDIAEWAGNHHERLNGTGYPEKLDERTLTKEDQIIAIADVFQALTEDRPYRKGMDTKEALNILDSMTQKGEISRSLFIDFKHLVTNEEVLI